MALLIVAKGEVKEAVPLHRYYIDDGKDFWHLGGWAGEYKGKTMVISIEEPEKEHRPFALKNLVAVTCAFLPP